MSCLSLLLLLLLCSIFRWMSAIINSRSQSRVSIWCHELFSAHVARAAAFRFGARAPALFIVWQWGINTLLWRLQHTGVFGRTGSRFPTPGEGLFFPSISFQIRAFTPFVAHVINAQQITNSHLSSWADGNRISSGCCVNDFSLATESKEKKTTGSRTSSLCDGVFTPPCQLIKVTRLPSGKPTTQKSLNWTTRKRNGWFDHQMAGQNGTRTW